MLRLETVGEHTSRAPAPLPREAFVGADPHVLQGRLLEQARTSDRAWRRARARPVQDRLELAFGTQALGQWMALTSFGMLAVGAWGVALVCCLIALCGFELSELLARAFISPLALPGVILALAVAIGLVLGGLGRCRRRQLLRWAQRHSIDVQDPGDPELPTLEG